MKWIRNILRMTGTLLLVTAILATFGLFIYAMPEDCKWFDILDKTE